MKRLFYTLASLITLATSLAACMSDTDNESDLSSNCYISAFTLGTMRRVVHTTTSIGNDSTFYITFSGTYYPLTVDQRACTITNAEPLPYGTMLGNALAAVTATGSIIYAPENGLTDSTMWTTYSSSDSINFAEPLLFRVYAYDGSGYRQYRVWLNVRTSEKNTYTWEEAGTLGTMTDRTQACLLMKDGLPTVLSTDNDGHLYATTANGEETPCDAVADNALPSTCCRYDGRYWLSTADGCLLCSDDAIHWQTMTQADNTQVCLLTASDRTLHALLTESGDTNSTTKHLAFSTDGQTWTLQEKETFDFGNPITALSYTQTNGNRRVLVAAVPQTATEEDTPLNVWSLLEDSDEPWMRFSGYSNGHELPHLQPLAIIRYNNKLLALGGQSIDGTVSALSTVFVSQDNGITWWTSDDLTLPTALAGTSGVIAATSDDEHIWLLAGTQLWKAHFNP